MPGIMADSIHIMIPAAMGDDASPRGQSHQQWTARATIATEADQEMKLAASKRRTLGCGLSAGCWIDIALSPSSANEKVEQLAANNLTMPQDAIASLLQRLVRPACALYDREIMPKIIAPIESKIIRMPMLVGILSHQG
jgi:hypothetical protein